LLIDVAVTVTAEILDGELVQKMMAAKLATTAAIVLAIKQLLTIISCSMATQWS